MAQVLGVVVAYHPEAETLENLHCLLQQVDHLVIVDNSSTPTSQELWRAVKDQDRLTTILNQENHGVAAGFNQGLRWGLENDFQYFLLMDQDSRVTPNMVAQLIKAEEALQVQGRLALVGPSHFDFNFAEMPSDIENETVPVELLITSGSLVSRRVIEKIGLYDERLFIDHVDHDYCLRLKQMGGVSVRVTTSILLHRFGQAARGHFLGKSFFLQNYSPFRRYYMMRNRIVLYKRYGMFSGEWFWMDLRSGVVDFLKLVFFEQDKMPKLQAVFRGLIDGFKWDDKSPSRR